MFASVAKSAYPKRHLSLPVRQCLLWFSFYCCPIAAMKGSYGRWASGVCHLRKLDFRRGKFSEVAWYQKSLNLLRRVSPLQGEKLNPGFTLQSAQKVVSYAEGWALWSPPWVVRRGTSPGAHVAHPYQL